MITFQEALDETKEKKRHLLLGNGFSISLFPESFTYGSLLEEADFSALPEIRKVFEALETTDFETVIYSLLQSTKFLPVYDCDSSLISKLKQHADETKEVLVRAIAGNHPERPSSVKEEQYQQCRKFLGHFAGEHRNQGVRRDFRGKIFSLNYDLLLYWTLLHSPEDDTPLTDGAVEIRYDDGFRIPDNDFDAEYVTWDGEDSNNQNIFYLHGALHLFDYGHELQKLCWERAGGVALIEQIRKALNEGRYPLFVSEGDSKGKYTRIRHADYLHKGLRTFRSNCKIKSASLFIYGHSLADNDIHILKQIEKGKIGTLYISIYGDPQSDSNQKIMMRGKALAASRPEFAPLVVKFFDAESVKVWS